MRNELGQFVKGNSGFWLDKKRPGLKTKSQFQIGQESWNKGKRTIKICEACGSQFSTNKGSLTKPNQRFCNSLCYSTTRRGANYGKKVDKTYRYQKFRQLVLERDKICVWCGSTENLQVDHIKPKALFPELMHDVSNGRVLCFDCHLTTDTYSHRALRKVAKT